MEQFEESIKVFRIVGLGEPLMHSQISKMCELLKNSNKIQIIEIITNAFLLNKKLSDKLIDKVDRLVISLQGITEESYKKISNVKINLNKFIDNIKYFYENKKYTHIYIKVQDISLKNEKSKIND